MLVYLIGVNLSFSQIRTGSLQGTVSDSTGLPTPGATIALVQPITGYRQTVITGADGSFRIQDIPFNTYTLQAEVPGFDSQEQRVEVRSRQGGDFDRGRSVGY